MPSQYPRELFTELTACLRDGRVPSEPVRRWWLDSVKAHSSKVSLEVALGLAGQKTWRARDAALREAAEIIAPGEEPKAQAKALLTKINFFETRVMPRYRSNPAQRLEGWKLALFRAFDSGRMVPRDTKSLEGILAKKFPDQ